MASSAKASTTILADSSSTSSSGIEYDVFLSFKGTDTRIEITDRLRRTMEDAGISVYRYDNEPHFKEELLPEVKEAIKQSRISIAILSIDYASSKSCLNQLVQMWECRILNEQNIIPIFCGISRSDVRDQAGDFGKAFDLHKTAGVDSNTIKTWEGVLREIGGLPNGYSGNLYRGFEGQLVEVVVARVAQMLLDDGLAATDKLVGLVLEMTRNLGVADSEGQATEVPGEDVRVVGIQGVLGVGKSTLAKESSSILSPSSGIEYEVYLNFRGPDTRKGITDHLYHGLVSAGIEVFRDDEQLHAEEKMHEIKELIQRSRISIPILSKNYASSKWCLNELVQMWKCRESNGQIIIPIFYDVSPSDVIQQAGDFGRSFDLHEIDRVDSNTIETWKEVLRQIGRIKGRIAEKLPGSEGGLVKEVVAHVVQLLKKYDKVVTDKLVGIDLHVQEMMRKLGVASREGRAIEVCGEEVRVVGIWGVPGVGKTTLAKVVFNKMHELFDACSFLEDISSERIQFLQQMLIADLLKIKPPPLKSFGEGIEIMAGLYSSRKVLIVLDDVCKDEQIKALAGKLTWFGPESRIIVTTNKREVLSAFNVGADYYGTVEEHKVEPMRDEDALQLFRKHAFRRDPPEDVSEYDSLSVEIVKAIGGLPSVIVDHASSLRRNMSKDIWRSTLDSLQKHPEDRPAAFQVSYT